MTRRWHWPAAVATALSLHLAVLAGWPQNAADGARERGEQGVDVGLGLLGELAEPEPEPPPEVVPPPPPPPKPRPEPPPPPPPRPEQRVIVRQPEPPPEAVEEIPDEPAPEVVDAPPNPPVTQPRRNTGAAAHRSTGGNPGVVRSYALLVAAHLNRHKRYPLASRRQREEGVVELRLVVERTGRVAQVQIRQAGPPALNEAALRMVEDAKPLPPFPPNITRPQLDIVVPVSFKLSGAGFD